MNNFRFLLIIIFLAFSSNLFALENCEWNNSKGKPCLTISKTPNSSAYNADGIKKIFTKKDIKESGATSAIDIIKRLLDLIFIKLVKRVNKLLFL